VIKFIVLLFIIFLIFIIIIIRKKGGKSFPWYEFYSRGRKEGFTFKEIGFLKKISIQNRLEKPQSIFWSTRQLDRCIRPTIQKLNALKDMAKEDKFEMISKLLNLRKKAEFNLPKYQRRIRDTKAILPRQRLIIRDKIYGNFTSWVIEINKKHMVVSQPSGQKGWSSLDWSSHKIGVYFWREDDAGYFFKTKVIEQAKHEEYPLLYLSHTSSLERAQKRNSVRIKTDIHTKYFPVAYTRDEGKNRAFITKKGHSGKIIDISESGCCMIAGKMLKKNDRLKIDFFLTEEKRVVALGIVVHISRTNDERVKKYHILFMKIGSMTRNNILLYIYNIFGERSGERSGEGKKIDRKKRSNIKPVTPIKPLNNEA